MKKEIGSEFWKTYRASYKKKANEEVNLLSGRTALRVIIDDVRKTRNFRKVLLPSYCCESMIQPFAAVGIVVEFYQVLPDFIDYPYGNDADATLLIDFFGYISPHNSEIAQREKQAGKIILYDATHKLDGNQAVETFADYSFCSYRKWFYCNYAQAIKRGGILNCGELRVNDRYIAIRDQAAEKKEKYITGLTVEKEAYLTMFSVAEQMLDEDYVGYAGKPIDFDINEIVFKRRENASYLIRELKKIPEIDLWRDAVGADDVPMFVPVLVDPHIRDDLRRYLINRQIYCPVHWPKSSYHGLCNELYDMELSLICDQRYDVADMDRIVHAIKDYFLIRGRHDAAFYIHNCRTKKMG